MITKLRNILGLSTLEESLTRYQDLSEDMNNINSQTDTLADTYYTRMRNYNEILKSSEYSGEIKNSVQTRFDAFLSDQKASVVGLVNCRHKVQKELSKLLKNDNLSKAVQELTVIEKAKENYKQNKISKNVYNDIIKAKKGKVHYSDSFVFWNGKLLIIQRASDDESANTWVLPGGHVDAGESHIDAAARELQEETGIECKDPVLLGKYDNEDVAIEYYTTNIESETEPSILLDTFEHQSYKWIDVNKELDNYEFPFNMKENIEKILLPEKQDEVKILKAVNMFIGGQISKQVLSDIVKANKDKIKGGIGDNKTVKDIAKKHKVSEEHIQSQLKMGIDVEMEHTKDKKKAKEIAMDHLMESPDYYTKLAEMEDSFEKARTGRYSDTPENRNLKRVGQQYGTKGTQDTPEPKEGKKEPETDEKQDKDIPIEDHAKQSSETALQNAAKGGDEELRLAAKKELDRREKEESVKEDEGDKDKSNENVPPIKEK